MPENDIRKEKIVKAITIWEPYASSIANGKKKYETRTWKTNYRGPIVIHASARKMSKEHVALAQKVGIINPKYSRVVAIADLIDCIQMTEDFISKQNTTEISLGNWHVGNYAWKLDNVKIINSEEIIKGQQGMWNLKNFNF